MDSKQLLRTTLASLEAFKVALESQIVLIKSELGALEEKDDSKVTREVAADPDVLGIDTIGRVIKRRHLSPELVEKKRKLMKNIREQRLRDIEELKKLRAEREAQKASIAAVAGKRK